LAQGHLCALRAFETISSKETTVNGSTSSGRKQNQKQQKRQIKNCLTYNLGTGKGSSVIEIIETLSLISQQPIKTIIAPRRPGDLGCVVCDPSKAERELGWKAKRGLMDMCRDHWVWVEKNPTGY